MRIGPWLRPEELWVRSKRNFGVIAQDGVSRCSMPRREMSVLSIPERSGRQEDEECDPETRAFLGYRMPWPGVKYYGVFDEEARTCKLEPFEAPVDGEGEPAPEREPVAV